MLYLKIKKTLMGAGLTAASILLLTAANTVWAGCPASTVADMKGVSAGQFPQQFELAEFEKLAGCKMTFQGNPDIARLNGKIRGNPSSVPAVADRLPSEPLVYAPYDSIGKYGGTLDVLSNA
ncbi:MAG TPA: ABC transporter substrate-binding protein, partial [Deltaproteobacteria bacterium]|nr:ABC transporter substrate-binding protein [Deltaproteobacteria bacterium]